MDATATKRSAVFGTLSLVAFCAAALIGIGMIMSIASQTEEMASFDAIAGIGFGFIACVVSRILGMVGVAREERPVWPAVVGFLLSIVPGGIGIWILWKLLEKWYVG